MTTKPTSPAYRLFEYCNYGYEEFLWNKMDAKKMRPILQAFAKELMLEERRQIIEAFKFGFDCGGKSDDCETLAKLYWQVRYKTQEQLLEKEDWYVETKRNAT